ncbi:MAG: hypothetical protein MZV63_05095 [Marinilabiliales bacterium]|nr:hypothetical protein [Marinilabiliales bacterium]
MVRKGVLDLRYIEQGDEFSVKMNGEWEFYFNKFLTSSPSRGSDSLKPDCYGSVPSFWSDYRRRRKETPGIRLCNLQGNRTAPIRSTVTGWPLTCQSLTPHLRSASTALQRPGTVPLAAPPLNRSPHTNRYSSVMRQKATLSKYIIRVSNFEHRRGGFWMPLRIGTFHTIQSNFTNQWFISIAVTGMLFASFLFFFIFYLLDRRKTKLLMFSLLAASAWHCDHSSLPRT